MRDNVILTDCDGVLLNWNGAFEEWMLEKGIEMIDDTHYDIAKAYGIERQEAYGLIRMFNESSHVGYIPPFRDAIKYVKKLHEEHGYVFYVITSMSTDKYSMKLRQKNLEDLFGPTAISSIEFLDCGVPKKGALSCYENSECWWIEDKLENAVEGHKQGLRSILMGFEHNKKYDGPIPRVNSWKEIYDQITGF